MVICTKWQVLLALLLLMLLRFDRAQASSFWYVAPGGDNGNDCQSPATACATINGAINKAAAGDTIKVAVGTYTDVGDAVVILSKNMTLLGGWDSTFNAQNGISILDGENTRRGMEISNNTTVIAERVIVQRGFSAFAGAGIMVFGGNLTLNHSAVLNNRSMSTGGGMLVAGIVNLNNVTISGNTARSGGGIYMIGRDSSAVLTLKSSTITHNQGVGDEFSSFSSGGGINNLAATIFAQNTIIAGNKSAKGGNDCTGPITSLGYNVLGSTEDCAFFATDGDLTNRDAGLLPLVSSLGFYPLSADSPALDAGNPAGCTDHAGNPLPTDQRGAARQGRCDIGAFERVAAGLADTLFVLRGTPQATGLLMNFPDPLQVLAADKLGTPAPGVVVTFTLPTGGPSATFALSSAASFSTTTDANGIASVTLTANQLVGSYPATATLGSATGHFALTNLLITTTTTITAVTPEPSVIGEPISVTFQVTSVHDLPTGVVTVTVNGGQTGCSGSLMNGVGACSLVLQEVGTYSLTATFAESALYAGSSATVTHTVRLHAAYLPIMRTNPFLVTGQVTHNGVPAAGIQLKLSNAFDGEERPMTTDAMGKYYFWVVDEELLNRNPGWRVAFHSTDNNPNFVAYWSTYELQASDLTQRQLIIPTFDIGALELVTPQAGAKKDMPVEFRWKKRKTPGPNEEYQVFFHDQKSLVANGPRWPYPTEKETMDCVRYDEPIDLEQGEWWVSIHTSDGGGASLTRRLTIGKTLLCQANAQFTLRQ